ncbi:flavin-dependent monooxygenase [Roseomonas sp. GC11]|uniref:acyl-CoA dehydrogenase family protein n=1 Tax=Roseomonas sp. GC11 TaxID=2950546 RepID=UPI00210BE295|nr:acyl-CoA dehydrogenase family protein [Roseomonas sp. GC11]MCQ4159881.1 flavin-dependent monooxygenase [Roseomonas sp. GC11]
MNVVNDPGRLASTPPAAASCGTTAGAAALDALVAAIAARREEFERLSHVPRDIVAMMKAAGIFRSSTPRCFGGDALPPADFLRILERIAMADGSAAWVAAFGSANTYLAALPKETQREIYASGPDQVSAGGLYPIQPARAAPGGWSVTGRWHFASGCMGAEWIMVGIGIGEQVAAERGTATGKPLTAVLPAHQVEIVENWDVVGLLGTGSHDLRLRDRFVPEGWTFVRGGPPVIDEPLYRYPAIAYQAQVHAVVNLGMARMALDRVAEMSGGRKTNTGAPRLADRAYFRTGLGKAEAAWRAARAFFYETSESVWDTILAGNPVTPEEANLLRLSATHAAHVSADAIQQAYRIAGISAIYRANPLQRLARDSMVVTQHATLGEATYDGAGAIFAGAQPAFAYP